jgi:transcriptional antiterminator RfaH
MQEETRRVRGKFTTFMRPLFPGYLFVAFDKAHGGWQAVNSTYGITRLVSAGKTPVEVPLNLVSQLMQRCDTAGKLLPPKLLSPGDQVIINKGPFVEFIATIEALASDRRVWVLLEFMGQKTRVAVPADQLRTV